MVVYLSDYRFPSPHERNIGAWPVNDTEPPPPPDVEPIEHVCPSDLDSASGIAIACAMGLAFFCGGIFGVWMLFMLGTPR